MHKSKHQPSGIIIVWLGNDDKIHTQSIPANPMERHLMFAKQYAESEFLCHQIDYLAGEIKSMPMLTRGLTRAEARLALQEELRLISLSPKHREIGLDTS